MGDRCRSSHRCVGQTSDGPALTARDNTLCPGCVVDIQRRYDELPHLTTVLRTMKGGGTRIDYEPRVMASREPGVPLNLHVFSLLDDIDTAVNMVDGYFIRDLVMQASQPYMLWVREVEQIVDLDGVDRALRVQRVHQRASHMVGLAPHRDKRAAPCPDCQQCTLGQWGGVDIIDCDNDGCGMNMPREQYDQWCMELAQEHKKKVT